ncbi:MAG: LamG-like jellyroll fold domain-containing protein [Bacteroidales bacterium]
MNKGPQKAYFNSKIDLKKLIMEGNSGEATIEFWIRGKPKLAFQFGDLLSENDFFLLSLSKEGILQINKGSEKKTIALTEEVSGNEWNHFAINFNETNDKVNLSLLLNGEVKGEFEISSLVNSTESRNLFFKKEKGVELCLAELRAWNQGRSIRKLKTYYSRSFIRSSKVKWESYKDEGLCFFYGENSQEDLNWSLLPELKSKTWKNTIENDLSNARFVSQMQNQVVAEVVSDIEHPVLSNRELFVEASRGDYEDGIRVKWQHVKEIDYYTIYRIYPDRVDVSTITDLSGIDISDELNIKDKQGILPGVAYKYIVEGHNRNNSNLNVSGSSEGFIFFNGRVEGNIKTSGDIFVKDVAIELSADKGNLPSSAILFSKGDPKVVMSEVHDFRRKNNFNIEFWYKSASGQKDFNEVLKIGPLTVNTNGSSIKLSNGNTEIINQAFIFEREWNHFSFNLGLEACNVFLNGKQLGDQGIGFPGFQGNVKDLRLNTVCNSDYALDEFRIWNRVRTSEEIEKYYRFLLSGYEENLILYYKMDMNSSRFLFNQARKNIGICQAEWDNELPSQPEWLSKDDCFSDLVYGDYTNEGGNYNIRSINYGVDANGLSLKLTPKKKYHTFGPDKRFVSLSRSDNSKDYQKSEIDFRDESAMDIAGRLYYHDEDDAVDAIFPVPAGQTFKVGGSAVLGGDYSKTSLSGSYVISSPLGVQLIEVNNPVKTNQIGTHSLKFDGKDDYVTSNSMFNQLEDLTLGFWIFFSKETVELQSVLNIGDLEIQIVDGNRVALVNREKEVLKSKSPLAVNTWHFIGVSYDKSEEDIMLIVDDRKEEKRNIELALSGKLTLGTKMVNALPNNFFKGNLDDLSIYNSSFSEAQLLQLKEGKIINLPHESMQGEYHFEEEEGLRSISWSVQGHIKTLDLFGDIKYDAKIFHPYLYEYQFDYKAVNDRHAITKDGKAYRPNVLKPITEVDFENKTRFGIVGNIITPCGCGVGEWVGEVVRVDVDGGKVYNLSNDNFNDEFTAFSIGNLMPGEYEVRLRKKDNPSITNDPLNIDLRSGWNIYNFNYENPLIIEAEFIRKAIFTPKQTWEFAEVAENCEDKYVLDKVSYYDLRIKSYELYGDEECPIGAYKYTIPDNDLGIAAPKTSKDTPGEYVMPACGIDTVRVLIGDPNFIAPYTRKLSVVTKEGGGVKKDILAFVVGVKQFNQDFTIDPPDEMIMVLHDPPGDNSSLSWNKGNVVNFSTNWELGGGLDLKFDISTGVDLDSYQGQWFGVGGGILMMQRMIWSKANSKFNTSHVVGANYAGGKTYSVQLDQNISTNGGGTTVGKDADVFVGVSSVITMGLGKSLSMENCAPVMKEVRVAVPQAKSMFVHSHQHISDRIIPNWELLRKQAEQRGKQDSVDLCVGKIQKWESILQANIDKIEKTAEYPAMTLKSGKAGSKDIESSFNFSSGSTTSWTIGKSNGSSHGMNQNYSGDISTDFQFKFNAFGADVTLKTGVRTFWNENFSLNKGNQSSESFTINFSDDDDGDQFDILIRKDPDFGCPIFKTRSGSSMCPFEEGTQPREGVELVAENSTVFAQPGKPAVFKLKIRNTQVADDQTTKHCLLVPLLEHYPPGALVKISGGAFNAPKRFDLDPGEETESIVITIKQGPGLENQESFEKLPFVAVSACEFANDSYVYSADEYKESGIRVVDTVFLTANYHRNCVENIEMLLPEDDWFINAESQDLIPLKFKLDAPLNSLTKVKVELCNQGSSNPSVIKEFLADELAPLTGDDGYISTNIRIGRPNGAYKLRLVPVCGLGGQTWRQMTPTAWVNGNIQRIAPIITQVEPQNNTVLGSGQVIRAYLDHPILEKDVNDMNVILRGSLPSSKYVPSSIVFNQTTDSISAENAFKLSASKAFTIEFWLYPQAFPTQEVPLVKMGDLFDIRFSSQGKLYNGSQYSTALVPYRWTHVAVIYNGKGDLRTFLDGELTSSSIIQKNFKPDASALIIGGINSSKGSFMGRMDELRIWNKSRTLAEILTYRRKMCKGDEDGLQFYLPMDDVKPLGVNGIQEIIGNASNLKVQGITFTKEKDEAAPIKIEDVVENIPIQVSLTNGNEVLITPIMGMDKLEGAQLIAKVYQGKLQDAFENKVKGKTWFFRVNQNSVEWATANLDIEQEQGKSVKFNVTLVNNGSSTALYELIDLPSWVKLVNSSDAEGELKSGFSSTIGFETAAWLNPGTHTAILKAKTKILNPLDGTLMPAGIETVEVGLSVGCKKPTYNFNPLDFLFEMTLTADLYIEGEVSTDPNDVVIAKVGDEVRGVASPIYNASKDKYFIQMQIFSNSMNKESLDFIVWDANTCKEYIGIKEDYIFECNKIKGNTYLPLRITPLGKEIHRLNLRKGSHLLSFNLQKTASDEDILLSQFSGFKQGDFIMDSKGDRTTYNNGSWQGDLKKLSPYASYVVYVKDMRKIKSEGWPAKINRNISLNTDELNWIGYVPESMMRISEGLRSLMATTLRENDRISGKYGLAEYIDGEWYGSLEYLTPGQGYKLSVVEPGILNYIGVNLVNGTPMPKSMVENPEMDNDNSSSLNFDFIAEEAKNLGFSVQAQNYSQECYFTGVIVKGGRINNSPMLLQAYCNDTLVGVSQVREVDGQLRYYMNVYSNTESKNLTFEMLDLNTGRRFEAKEKESFESDAFFGSTRIPYEFSVGSEIVVGGDGMKLFQNYPNPFKTHTSISYYIKEKTFVKLDIYTMQGKRMFGLNYKQLPSGSYDINLRNAGKTKMMPGVYLYCLETKFGRMTKKMIVQ